MLHYKGEKMGTFITIAIIAINLFAIILNFKMLKGMEINKILMYIIITEIVLLIQYMLILLYQVRHRIWFYLHSRG